MFIFFYFIARFLNFLMYSALLDFMAKYHKRFLFLIYLCSAKSNNALSLGLIIKVWVFSGMHSLICVTKVFEKLRTAWSISSALSITVFQSVNLSAFCTV